MSLFTPEKVNTNKGIWPFILSACTPVLPPILYEAPTYWNCVPMMVSRTSLARLVGSTPGRSWERDDIYMHRKFMELHIYI